jgi:hypothetical protein
VLEDLMSEWANVRWTEAAQIMRLLGYLVDDDDPEPVLPDAHFGELVARESYSDAVTFLAVALPRFDAVTWAARILEAHPSQPKLSADRAALAAVLDWLDDPSDLKRRTANTLAEKAALNSPEQLLALATFMSGGSIAPEDINPILPPPEVCGKLVSAAILAYAFDSPDPQLVLIEALEAGSLLARKGAD